MKKEDSSREGRENFGNIRIIGTSHISSQSVREIDTFIQKEKPDIVAVELDHKRFHALHQPKRGPSFGDIGRIGLTGYVFGLLAYWVQQKLGQSVGVSPGDEMKHAIRLAKKHSLEIAFIDQDIEITLRKLNKSITWKEKWRFFADIIKGIFMGKRMARQMGLENLDLEKVPSKELIRKMLGMVRQRYPNVYKCLISDRDRIMAMNLIALSGINPSRKILAVVGAGHEEGIGSFLEKNQSGKIDYTFSITAGSQVIRL